MNTPLLRIGSRASDLARAQAEWTAERIETCTALVWIKSTGDQDQTTELAQFGGVGVFTVELHRALFDDRIDLAVHSLKDLPAAEDDGIRLACVPVREDVHDTLIARDGHTLESLPPGAKIGTGSPRRVAQLKRARPDLEFVGIRGNVDTRLKKVSAGEVDAVVLAHAGLRRLGLDGHVTQILDKEICVPAAGQGALGYTTRVDDARAEEAVSQLRDVKAAACTAAERSALHGLGAGCHAPVGANAIVEDGTVKLHVRLCSLDGTECFESRGEGGLGEAAEIGRRCAEDLLSQGAGPLLETGPHVS